MRKLLNTLFVLSETSYLTLDGENVVVLSGKETIARFPLHTLENIYCFTYKGATPALMGACAKRKIGLCLFSPQGRFEAKIVGEEQGNVLLRKEQYRISDNEIRSCEYSKQMILGKVFNCKWSLERTVRDHGLRVDKAKIKHVSGILQNGLSQIRECKELSMLRGIEGELASQYFKVFDELIINQKDVFTYCKRSRRPPLDNVNALLSFSYTVLASECANALTAVGLDAYVGFLHRDRPGRRSLALDLMEELRGIMADRFVLTLINNKILQSNNFEKQENGAVMLNDSGRRQFFGAWQNKKKEKIKHPYLDEQLEWGLVPYVQALLLSRTIRGDLQTYPPFLWK